MYERLFKSWRKEDESPELSELSNGFWEEIKAHIKKVGGQVSKSEKGSIQRVISKQEIKNVHFMLNDLIRIRRRKLVQLISKGEPSSNKLSTTEKEIFEESKRALEGLDQIGSSPTKSKTKEPKPKPLTTKSELKEKSSPPKYFLIRFLSSLPAITGYDMKNYGPFKVEDIATLPSENARALIDKGVAVEHKIGRSKS